MSAVEFQIQLVCYNYIAPFVCWLGIVTNVVNLIVLTRPNMKSSAYTFLTALAVTDMGTLILFFLFTQVSSKAGNQGMMGYFWTAFNVYIVNPGLNVFCCASVWIIVLITIDRYISIIWPLLAKVFCSRKYARRKVCLAFILALSFNSMRLCQYSVTSVIVNNTMVTEIKATPLRWSNHFSVFLWVYTVAVMYIPSCLLLVANSYLLIHLRHTQQQRLKLIAISKATGDQHPNQRDHIRLTVTLVAITFSFVICIIPSSFSEPLISYTIFGGGQIATEFFSSPSYIISVTVFNMLVLCNASMNFFMYCAFNQNFSQTMRKTISMFVQSVSLRFKRENSQTISIIERTQRY